PARLPGWPATLRRCNCDCICLRRRDATRGIRCGLDDELIRAGVRYPAGRDLLEVDGPSERRLRRFPDLTPCVEGSFHMPPDHEQGFHRLALLGGGRRARGTNPGDVAESY